MNTPNLNYFLENLQKDEKLNQFKNILFFQRVSVNKFDIKIVQKQNAISINMRSSAPINIIHRIEHAKTYQSNFILQLCIISSEISNCFKNDFY